MRWNAATPGIILNIKPRIADNGVVTLDIGQEISSVAAGGNTLTPTISNRAIKRAASQWSTGRLSCSAA